MSPVYSWLCASFLVCLCRFLCETHPEFHPLKKCQEIFLGFLVKFFDDCLDFYCFFFIFLWNQYFVFHIFTLLSFKFSCKTNQFKNKNQSSDFNSSRILVIYGRIISSFVSHSSIYGFLYGGIESHPFGFSPNSSGHCQ